MPQEKVCYHVPCLRELTSVLWSQDGAVSTVISLHAAWSRVEISAGTRDFSLPLYVQTGSEDSYTVGTGGLSWSEAEYLPPSCAKVKNNERRYNCILRISLHGVHRDNFNFNFTTTSSYLEPDESSPRTPIPCVKNPF
jgi:hypothetical protein